MALVKAMTDDAGVRVGALHAISSSLFELCARESWAGVERSILVVELARVRVEFAPEHQIPQLTGIGIVVPCRPIVADLRERLLTDKEKIDQRNLPFAPTMVASDTRGRRAS
jgi:hypothetical protein